MRDLRLDQPVPIPPTGRAGFQSVDERAKIVIYLFKTNYQKLINYLCYRGQIRQILLFLERKKTFFSTTMYVILYVYQ